MTREPVRIGNCSGFYGDRMAALTEMTRGGPLDVVTGDYLAELTMLILVRSQAKDPSKGYATTFLRQLEPVLGEILANGTKVVVNAGGLNPAGCAQAVRDLAAELGLSAQVGYVTGDDLLSRVDELRDGLAHLDTGAPLTGSPLSANAYLGAFGIARCLQAGADIVVTGRVTDASLVVGPAAWWHGWGPGDLDQLAGAVVAGHVLECGTQATGGNYSFFREVPDLTHAGFPLAEVAADGSCVVTKHPGTGGLVSTGAVTAQLLYEIGAPQYLGPDVVADFTSIQLSDDGPDRVRISGVRGTPPPPTTKVCLNLLGGLRNSVTFLLTGLDLDAKADLVRAQLADVLAAADSHTVTLERTTADDPASNPEAVSRLVVTVKGSDPKIVGRAFSSACVELALASYPGLAFTAPPGQASPYGVYWPALVPCTEVSHLAVLPDGEQVEPPAYWSVSTNQPTWTVTTTSNDAPAGGADQPQGHGDPTPPDARAGAVPPAVDAVATAPTGRALHGDPTPPNVAVGEAPPGAGGATRRVPLGTVAGARSGDKGGKANIGVWVRTNAGYEWLRDLLTPATVRALLPETADLPVQVHHLPNLRAVNIVVDGILGEGVSSSTRLDPQAKGLGEWLRARLVDVPENLLSS